MEQDPNSNPLYQFIRAAFHSQPNADGQNNAPSAAHEATVSHLGVNAQQSADAQMDNSEYDDMPGLQEVSDSDSEGESESDRDANEVEMQAVERNDSIGTVEHPSSTFPSLAARSAHTPTAPAQQNSNRRPRVDDDNDEERDRRHPSQRVSSANGNAASSSSAAPTSPSIFLPHSQPHTHTSTPTSGATPPSQPPPQRPPSNVQRHVFHTTINLGNGGPPNNPFRLFQHLVPTNLNPTNNTNNNNPVANPPNTENREGTGGEAPHGQAVPPTDAPQPDDGQNGRRQQPQLFGGMLSFDLRPGGHFLPIPGGVLPPIMPFPMDNGPENADPNAPQQPGQLPPHLADLLARIGAQVLGGNLAGLGFGLENQEDPDRARKLVDGLEVVPEGLVRRLERVGGSGGGMGEDPTKGGDNGCAICWDRLLDTDGAGFGPSESTESEEKLDASSSSEVRSTQPKIVSLPCAHVFHAECLVPWFSRPRQTTCPTCRFNIDPDNLTYVSWHRRQRERREAEAAAAGTAGGADPADAPPAPDATLGTETPGATLGAEASGVLPDGNARTPESDREDIFRQFTNLYANAHNIVVNEPPPTQQERQQQEHNQPQAAQHPPITVTAIPITIPIPVAIPMGGINAGQMTPNATASTTSEAPNVSELSADTPQGEEHQPRPESAPRMAGEYARLFARLGRPSHMPVPLDALFPQSFHRLGTPQAPHQDIPPNVAGNAAPAAGGPSGQARRFSLDPLGRLHRLDPTAFGIGPTANANPAAPNATPRPPHQTNTNTFNLAGLDFGIPGLRADVVVTMDMFFDPRGPPAPDRPEDDRAAGEHRPHEGDVDMMEEDIMMMMPEEHEEEEAAGDDMAGFGEEMLRMFTGAAHDAGNDTNANPRNLQPQPQPEQDQAPPAANTQQPGLMNMGNGIHFAAGSGRSVGEAFAQLLARMSGGTPPQAQQGPAGEQAAQAQPPASEPAAHQLPEQVDEPADAQPEPRARVRNFAMPPGGIGGLFAGFPGILGGTFGGLGPRPPSHDGPKPAWSVPPAPGLTLRQRVERREREAGLRCYDISCGLGPSDEDSLTDKASEVLSSMKQLVIHNKHEGGVDVCEHRLHSACLVSAERVALRGADAVVEDGRVDVSCPVCRTTGCVTKEEWDEGVIALEC